MATEDPAIVRAVTKALDIMADCLPGILALSDSRIIALQDSIEASLTRALAGKRPG